MSAPHPVAPAPATAPGARDCRRPSCRLAGHFEFTDERDLVPLCGLHASDMAAWSWSIDPTGRTWARAARAFVQLGRVYFDGPRVRP